ncbi:MAG: hypothetical protein KAK00_02930 [Nanoarchaeota archaeon]|nr:hypothetical protein [Nanoarchaeota archaeon]
MGEAKGIVIGTKTSSPLHKKKNVLEIELDKQDKQLLNWQNKRILIRKIE